MSKFLALLRKYALAAVVSVAGLVVVGVGYFDTYPTYFAKNVTLSEKECSQTAALVAVHAFKLQNPDVPVPEVALVETSNATRLAKRTARYIIERSPGVNDVPPGVVYEGLLQSCIMAGGKAELK